MRRIQPTKNSNNKRSGFTMVEVAIVVLLVGMMFPLFSFILNMYHDAYYLDDRLKMNSEASQALWYIEDSVRTSASFMATIPAEYPDHYGPNNLGTAGAQAWSHKGNSASNRVLITQDYSTTANPLNTARQPVFIDSAGFNCTDEMFYNPQLTYISIYFVREGTLYYRVLTDKTTPLCAGNVQQQKTSCPPYITVGRHSSCETNDEILATNVSNFSVAYYRILPNMASEQIDPSYTSMSSSILADADYAVVTLSQSIRNGAITTTFTQRMTKVNQ